MGNSISPSISVDFKWKIFDQVSHPCCWKPFPFIFYFVNYCHEEKAMQARSEAVELLEWDISVLLQNGIWKHVKIWFRKRAPPTPFQLCNIITLRIHLTLLNLLMNKQIAAQNISCFQVFIKLNNEIIIGRSLRNFLRQCPNLTSEEINKTWVTHRVKFWSRNQFLLPQCPFQFVAP